jgi:nucleoid DNA-binding protein
MTKSQVVSHLAAKAGIKKKAAKTVLDELATLATQMPQGRNNQLVTPGIAKTVKVYRNPRTGRNSRNGEPIKIETNRRVNFRRASADSDEVFANLAKAFSNL